MSQSQPLEIVVQCLKKCLILAQNKGSQPFQTAFAEFRIALLPAMLLTAAAERLGLKTEKT